MKSITLIFLTLLSLSSFAQIGSDLEIYAEKGEKFTVTINGRLLNEEAASNVSVTNINYDNVHIVITFEDQSIQSIEKKYLGISNVKEVDRDKPVITTYKIVEKKGNYKLRFASRSNKKIQQNTVIINQEQPQQNGVLLSNGKVVINW